MVTCQLFQASLIFCSDNQYFLIIFQLTPEYRDHCSFQEPLGRLITENRHMDIYDYTEQGDKIWDPSEGGHKFKRSDVFPLQKCMLMGHETKCPNKPKEFLSQFYNNLSPLSLCKNGKWIKKKGWILEIFSFNSFAF